VAVKYKEIVVVEEEGKWRAGLKTRASNRTMWSKLLL
jgi:hypothetical protein